MLETRPVRYGRPVGQREHDRGSAFGENAEWMRSSTADTGSFLLAAKVVSKASCMCVPRQETMAGKR
jgi:hypothetical protein